MPQYLITGPDGNKYKVNGPTAEGALAALKRHMGATPAPAAEQPAVPDGPVGDPNHWGTGYQAADTVTMGGSTKLGAVGGALVDSLFGAAQGQGWNYGDAYNKNLEQARADQEAYSNENPIRTGLGTAGGVAMGITNAPVLGRGLLGGIETGLAYGAGGGALQDANSIGERIGNTAFGGVTGGFIGGAGYGLGKAAGIGMKKAGEVASTLRAPPEVKAASQFYKTADDVFGPNNAMAMSRRLHELGPDAINADVLGARGTGLGRGAANISPEARETLESTVQARKANQNSRLATDVEALSGLPTGNTKNVDALKKEAYDKVRPQIGAAYDIARKAGNDIPLQAFDNIITTPVGRGAFKQALDNITSRAARDPSAGGNLAVLDETKRLLDGYATQAYRSGDPMAGEYAATAKALRDQLDSMLSGNEYAAARGLRQEAYKADNAFDLGAQLGANRIPLGLPESAAKVQPNLKRNVARAYGATKVENLLNKPSTEGAFNDLMTPQGKKAAQAALGNKQAGLLGKALDREKTFNITNRELLGNSTTARQLAEMAGTGVGTMGAGMLLGYDPTTSGIAGGLAALGRKAVPTITRRLVTENQRAVAPYIAKLLTSHGVPVSQPIPVSQLSQFLERFATAGDAKLAKTMALIWAESQKNSPQTNPAK